MISIGKCTLRPVPHLRAGTLTPEQVSSIARVFLNWNPHTGSYPGIPGRLGAQPFKTRMRGPKVIQDSSLRIFESLDAEGQKNPVLLWCRWGSLFVSYGGTRVLWALDRGKHLNALIVDYDAKWPYFRKVAYSKVLKEFTVPPMGVVPCEFGWKDGIDYVLADAEHWEIKDIKDIKDTRAPARAPIKASVVEDVRSVELMR